MDQLIQQLINRLVALESEFDSLPDLSIIQELIKDIEALKQNETFTKETLKDAVTMFGNGYITTKSDELFAKLSETFNKLSDDNSTHTETKSSELSLKIDGLFQEFKTDLNKRFYKELLDFKEKADEHQLKIDDMVQNALLDIKLKLRDVKNGRDGIDGKDGIGIEGQKGRDGIDGANGVGIDDITYKSNTITIFLSNGTKKDIRLNIPISMGGGGVSETRVMQLISESLGNSIDAYTKSETDTLIASAIDDLINGASNILDSFGEVESVLDVLQSSISANSQAIANLSSAQGQFGTTTPLILTTSEQPLSFDVSIQSTDSAIMVLNDLNNSVSLNATTSFNFRTDMTFSVDTSQSRIVTIRGRRLSDNQLIYSRTVSINQQSNSIKSISSSTLVALGQNGVPESPFDIYFTIQCDGTDITMNEFNSIIASSGNGVNDATVTSTIYLDFGNIGTKYKLFTINDANLTSGKTVSGLIYKPSSNIVSTIVKESIDDDEFDSIDFSIRNISLGSFQILAKSNGIINNYKTIQYTIH